MLWEKTNVIQIPKTPYTIGKLYFISILSRKEIHIVADRTLKKLSALYVKLVEVILLFHFKKKSDMRWEQINGAAMAVLRTEMITAEAS